MLAETWTLEDKQGREIVVDQLFYDGVNLSVRREGAYNKMKIPPEMLSKKCWEDLSQSMSEDANISLEVVRRTKTSTDTDRNTTQGYYTYSSEEKEVKKMNHFEMSMRSSSHFESQLKVEYFIISDREVDCGVLSKTVSFAEPLELAVSKAVSHTEYNYKSSYGYKYESKTGDSKAGVVVFVYNTNGDEVAQYASSNKLLDEFRSYERSLRAKMKPANKRKKGKNAGQANPSVMDQMTIVKSTL